MKQRRFLSVLLALCLVLGMCPGTVFAAGGRLPFTDVKTADWYYDAVQYVYVEGMMNGTGAATFSPNSTTSRGMIVTILHRLDGTPSATGAAFTDVPAGQWYTDAVAWASANEIVGGYGNGKFGPDDPITREQMATILYRYSQYKGYDTTVSGSLSGFPDAAKTSSYAADAMRWAVGTGLIAGMDDGTLAPQGNATRAQVATIFTRYCENVIPTGESELDKPASETYTVTFAYNYGSQGTYKTLTVTAGETVARPDDPSRSGYAFDGWYTSASGGSKFDFGSAITGDITLYAKWSVNSGSGNGNSGTITPVQPITYTVTFDSNGGSTIAPQVVKNGSTVTPPANPIKEGYIFAGWYSNSTLENVYDFSAAVVANITLYAKWKIVNENDQLFVSSDAYISLPDEENIVVDPESGIEFINNELIVHAEIGTNRNSVISLISSFGGEIIGEISATDTYQIQFTNSYTVAEIAKLQSEIEASSLISWTSIDLVFYEECSYYPISDTEWANDWYDTIPSGLNWGVEAIHAPEAWDYRESMSYVHVGIFDDVFYDHNDLVWSNRYFNDPDNCESGHGTHVAGTIAAGFDNGTGITGVAPYVDLYGFSYGSSIALEGQSILALSEMALDSLLHNDQCKVLNCSNNISYNGKSTSLSVAKGDDEAREFIETGSEELGRYLNRLLELGDDFVICVTAGNKNDDLYITENGVITSGDINAFYNSFYTAITDPGVKNHIVVVGACKNDGDGTYTYSSFSNIGSRVDVVAPGENIYSTVDNNGYDSYSGTSMAAPHVSGIAAMLYAIDPTIKGDRVKEIILETATTDVDGCSYKMVNAVEAVSKAYTESRLTLTGEIVDKISGESISNATITVKNQSGQTVKQTVSNEDGKFSIIGIDVDFNSNDIFWGTYSVEVEKEGYSTIIILSHGSAIIIDKVYDLGTIEISATEPTGPIDPIITPAISGIVKDADTGKPVEGVTVYLMCIFGAGGEDLAARCETAADGTFKLTVPAGVTAVASLWFEKEGYNNYILPLNANLDFSTNVGTVRLTKITPDSDEGPYAGGDGTEENPYHISTAEQLVYLAKQVNNGEAYAGTYFELIADIDLSQYASWTPIGSNDYRFKGNFDGNGYQISNMNISESSGMYFGLFGYIHNATIKNVILDDVNISINGSAQVIGGITGGAYASNVLNCTVSGTISVVSNGPISGLLCGGIVGIIGGTSNITNCSNRANIDCGSSTQIGGIVGSAWATLNSTIRIIGCTNSGSIIGGNETGEIAGSHGAYPGSSIVIE